MDYNSWSNENYQNMMGNLTMPNYQNMTPMPPQNMSNIPPLMSMPNMPPDMSQQMPPFLPGQQVPLQFPNGPPPPGMPPLMPPNFMFQDMNMGTPNQNQNSNFIGPVRPENNDPVAQMDDDRDNDVEFVNETQLGSNQTNQVTQDQRAQSKHKKNGKESWGRKDKDREREHERGRDRDWNRRDRSRDSNDRGRYNDRRSDRDRGRADRSRDGHKKRWDNDGPAPGKVLLPGMPGFPMAPTMGMMPPGAPDMAMNMGNMLPGMYGMMGGMPPGMPNAGLLPNQKIFINRAILLPPAPGTSLPPRRDKPMGCRTIFVGGLPCGITDAAMREMFQRFGVITDVKLMPQGVCHVRFADADDVDKSFVLSGYRFQCDDQMEAEATTLFIDYALNRDDFYEYERKRLKEGPSPPPVEPCSVHALDDLMDKIKDDDKLMEVTTKVSTWLERGDCNKQNSDKFYKLIQSSNYHVRRLYNEKMALDEEFHIMKTSAKTKFSALVEQFEQVSTLLCAAREQRVADHFSKQQRKNIDLWYKISEEVESMKEEFLSNFKEDDDGEVISTKNMVPVEVYEELKSENLNLMQELEGYKNEAHLAKDEAERKFEKFKAQWVAQQALRNTGIPFSRPPSPPKFSIPPLPHGNKSQPPPPPAEDFGPSDARVISILTAFLMVHPLGTTFDCLVGYVKTMVPNVTRAAIQKVLERCKDVFQRKTCNVAAGVEIRWGFVMFDNVKIEALKHM